MLKSSRFLARLGLFLRVPGTVSALRATVFRQFCGGTSLDEAIESAREMYELGVRTILDYAVEAVEDETGFDAVAAELERVVDATAEWPAIELVAVKVSGLVRPALLEKVSRDEELDDAERVEFASARKRLHSLAEHANNAGVALFMDAEHSWIQPAINDLVEELMEQFNAERAVILTTVQLYLRGGYAFLERSIEKARAGNYKLGVKLVRGAYLEQENERAKEERRDSPIQPSKAATDTDYDRATTLCLENIDIVTVCAATHNAASTYHLLDEMKRLEISEKDPRVSSSQLMGMFDRITYPLAECGYNVFKYVPYGGVRDALPYLLRRADENKSVADQLGSELQAVRGEMKRRGLKAL
jgi:proline dehydrogenase